MSGTELEKPLPDTPSQSANHPSDKQEHDSSSPKKSSTSDSEKSKKEPPGGYDATPIPKAPPGWTVKFTFHRAANLPMADINSLSSDPYLIAQLNTGLPTRHKEDPALRFRTQTIRKNVDPVWDSPWIVANVPSSGFKMKIRLYDEDPADHDDRLGNVHINVDRLSEDWPGIKEQAYGIKKRMGSKRAYLIRAVSTCVGMSKHMHGELVVSVEVVGRTKDESGGRAYTVGPSWFTQSYSPVLGRITGTKSDKDNDKAGKGDRQKDTEAESKRAQSYNFQANQMQLAGPVPAELYHRYVEFKPFVRGMFTDKGIRGFLLNKALHHQHARVYSYDRQTIWGYLPTQDPQAVTKRFLELVHYDKGGRLFTYVLTLDAIMRFTETGKEFGIDMLSKHTMHSDVSAYIAFSGEFFIRRRSRRAHKSQQSSSSDVAEAKPSKQGRSESPDGDRPVAYDNAPEDGSDKDEEAVHKQGGQVNTRTPIAHETKDPESETPTDPAAYELYIDNDSGTYRPNAKMLPLLRKFMSERFPGLHVNTLDCQADEEKMKKLKDEQRQRKKDEVGNVVFTQRRGSRSSSVSSSDEEDLDEVGQGGATGGLGKMVKRDAVGVAKGKVGKFKSHNPRHERGEGHGGEVSGEPGTAGEEQSGGLERGEKIEQEEQAAQTQGQGQKGVEEQDYQDQIEHRKTDDAAGQSHGPTETNEGQSHGATTTHEGQKLWSTFGAPASNVQ